MITRIEVEFAIPVDIDDATQEALHDIIGRITRSNTPDGQVHWLCGYGHKPIWSRADAAFLGKSQADDVPDSGEPTFDASVLHFETCCREDYGPRPHGRTDR